MASKTLFLFGDQTGDILTSIQELSKLGLGCHNLSVFLRRSTASLHCAIAIAPSTVRRQIPSFSSPLELAAAVEGHGNNLPALRSALLAIVQFGNVIVLLESKPRALQDSAGQIAIFGICTGLLTAAAVSCCRDLADVISLADDIVQLAFRVGLEASRRSAEIDSSNGSWTTVVSHSNIEEVRAAVEDFNSGRYTHESARKAYISTESASSATISAPPSTSAELFKHQDSLGHSRKVSLPIHAAFHASHLEHVSIDRFLEGLPGPVLNMTVQHHITVSPHDGQLYLGKRLSEMLVDILDDIMQKPICLAAAANGLSQVLGPEVTTVSLGPVTCLRILKQALGGHGVELLDDERHVPRLESSTQDIAIVGMSVRLPGGETLDEFWKVLEQGLDLHEKIREDRFDVASHCDISGKIPNTTLTPYGVFIDRPGFFDTRLFNMSPREAAQTDPQQRMMLLTTYEALEMAGYTPNGTPSTCSKRVGSFMGQTSDDWREVNASQNIDTYFITGGIRAFGPGRLNYHFGWEGPSYSVDTACSSSASAIQLACSALLARECDTAVGGGANFLTSSDLFAGLSRGGFLSKTGGCKTFDHEADGYVRADAVGVVVLKRLEDALGDNDNVLAVLKAAVTNHSAEAISITHPHAGTQERLFNTALNQAGLKPTEIDYAELHGTGTQAGDATESRSVTNVLAQGRHHNNPLYIGTVKPNLGHGEAASGVTSLIKAVLMLRHSMIPPHIGIKGRINQKLPDLKALNTHISFGKTKFVPRPGGDGKRRILVNNFDAAGGNTSIIIEDPPQSQEQRSRQERADSRGDHVVAVSGKTPNAVLNNSKRLLEYVRLHPDVRLEDVAYTTTARRTHHILRSSHAVSSVVQLVTSLEKAIVEASWTKAPSSARPVVFLFTGQGSHYISMAAQLRETIPSFRQALQDYDSICVSLGFASFMPMIFQKSTDLSHATPVQVQLAIVAVELAIAGLWKSLGVSPTAVVGHSLGEYPALYTAGVISLRDCLYLVGKRASLMLSTCTAGTHAMLSVEMGLVQVQELLRSRPEFSECELACDNGPTDVVVSGPVQQVGELQQMLQDQGTRNTQLKVQYAFHSAQMDPLLVEYRTVVEAIHFSAPSITLASTLLGSQVTTFGVVDAEYLLRQTREAVQFTEAVKSLRSSWGSPDEQAIWVETGPSPVCLGLLQSTLGCGQVLLPSLRRNKSDWEVLAGSLSKAYNAGLDIDWRELHRPYEQAVRLLELPSYAFDLKNHWIQYQGDWVITKGSLSALSAPQNALQGGPSTFSTTSLHRIVSEVQDATGVSVEFASDAMEPKLNRILRGHLVNGAGLCPSSVYADMAFTAAEYIQNLSASSLKPAMDVRDMSVHKPLLIQPGDTKQIIHVVATTKGSSSSVQVEFSSSDGHNRQSHAVCTVEFGNGDEWKQEWSRNSYLVKERMKQLLVDSATGQGTHRILRPMVYKLFSALVDYDDKYQGLEEVYMDSNFREATANVKFQTDDADGSFTYSPYWIDSLAHLSGFVLNGSETTPADSVFISHGWESMRIVGQLSADKCYQSYVRMQETKTRGVLAGDVYFFEGDQVVALCRGLKFQRIKRTMLDRLLPPPGVRQAAEPLFATPHAVAAKNINSKATRPPRLAQITSPNIMMRIMDVIASEVGVDRDELTDDVLFADLGVDSLLSISITTRLGQMLGTPVPATLFVDYPSVKELRFYVAASHGDVDVDPRARGDSISSSDASDAQESSSASHTSDSSIATTPEEPRDDDFAETVKKIIASEIGIEVEEILDDTPLADLGVDSLLSLSILSAIKEHSGNVLPASFLAEHPTLAAVLESPLLQTGRRRSPPEAPQLIQALQKMQGSSRTAGSVLLQGSALSAGPSFFLLPDGSGSASSYVGLPALQVPGGGAVYGLNSPFLEDASSFTDGLEDVAAIYVREIRRVQPRGPYRLGGWSIGGSYAFEAARQLVELHGETVSHLVLIDAPCPRTLPPLPIETVDVLEEIGALGGLGKRNSSTARAGGGGRGAAERAGVLGRGVKAHFAGSINALKQYSPVAIPAGAKRLGSVKALWAKHGVWESVGDEVRARYESKEASGPRNAARDFMMDPRNDFGPNGWEDLVPGVDISCDVVSGDHFSIMRQPGVTKLGLEISRALLS